MRFGFCFIFLALVSSASAEPPSWVTVKGRVVLPEKAGIPVRDKLDVSQDKAHCLSKGDILDDKVLVNAKNRGIKNVVVWLRPDNKNLAVKFTDKEIHPQDAKRKPAGIVIDQPCCMFIPRITACRVGDTITVKNSAPVAHNFFWSSELNGALNVNIPAGGKHTFPKPLVAESSAIPFRCTIHPWMSGTVRIFDHPYFAVTNEDGKFEIKNAPAGKYRIVYWHENVGFKDGKEGRFGFPLTIAGGADNTMEMKPTDFNLK
jgi:plastocyanin